MVIERQRYLDKLINHMNNGLIKVITGIRRCGKSVILEQVQDEIDQGAKAIKLLGGGNFITEYFELPGTDYKRFLVKIEKVSSTPNKYPRKAGTPSKDPIQ